MKLVSFFLSALFLQNAMAKDPNQYIKTLNKINKTPLSVTVANQCLPEDASTDDLLQKCAVDLCGAPKDAVSGELTERTFDDYVKPDIMKRFGEIEKEITEIVKHTSAENTKFIENFRGKLIDGKLDLKFDEWESENYSSFTSAAYEQQVDTTTDKSQPIEKRLKLKAIYPKGSSEAYRKGLDAYISAKSASITKDIGDGLENDLYTKPEAKALVKKAWDDFYAKYTEKLKTKPDFMKDNRDEISKAQKEIADEKSGIYKLANLFSEIESLSSSYTYAETGKYPDSEEVNNCEDKACQLGIQDFNSKQNLSQKLADLEKENAVDELVKNELVYCKSNLAMKGLADSDKVGFLAIVPDIKKQIMEKATVGFSDHSKQALETYLNESLNLSFKGEKDSSVDEFIKSIQDAHKEIKEEKKPEEEGNRELVEKLLGFSSFGPKPNPMGSNFACESSIQAPIWDAFIPRDMVDSEYGDDLDFDKDNISVSKFSCTHQREGKSVIAHEMGHAMSYAFFENKLSASSLEAFKKLRACADSHHKEKSPFSPDPTLVHPGDTYRTEEDTADLISYMAYPESDLNYECALLSTSVDGEHYTDLSLENSIDQDTHSAPLFRALNEAVHKKKPIPASCTQLMKENPKFGFDPCF